MKLFILLLVIGIVAFAAYRHWFVISSNSDTSNDTVSTTLTVDKAKIKEDTKDARAKAGELGEQAKNDVKDIAHKISPGSSTPATTTTAGTPNVALADTIVELEPGNKAVVNVSRKGADVTQTLQLGMTVSEGSNLQVSGGAFDSGKTETSITVEAPPNAHPGKVFIHAEGGPTLELQVLVKPKP